MGAIILAVVAMLCILAIELMAMHKGLNGKVMALAIAAVAALGGASVATVLPIVFGK